jgi:hypothetical protein
LQMYTNFNTIQNYFQKKLAGFSPANLFIKNA